MGKVINMTDKIGRNELCSCGSGKKYKRCCQDTAVTVPETADFEWRKLRQLEGAVVDHHLMPYVTQVLPNEIIELALADGFPAELPETFDKELFYIQFFIPWFLFNWLAFDDVNLDQFDPNITIAQNYIKYYESKLNSAEKRFIETISQTYYSFYSVLEVKVEESLILKDILLGTTHIIKERQGTHYLKRGDIVFSRILTLEAQSIFVGMAPFLVPASYHTNLIDFRDWLIEENDQQALNPKVLRTEFDLELMDYFFEIIQTAFNKPLPTLLNTDGDLLQFSKSYFDLTLAPEEVLNCLLSLTLSNDADEFLQDAKRDKAGNIKQIELPWLKKGNKKHKSWNNTVMGHILIEKDRLILETNSEQRTQRGKKLLSQYLGDNIHFRQTLIESPEQKLKSLPTSYDVKQEETELLALPEVQEQLKAMAKAHWESWFNEPIPALNNQTPREASKTKAGRERLEALLLQYERHDVEKCDHDFFKADIRYLRTQLALDR